MQLVDGIDIVRALAGMGLAARKDIAKAVQDAVRVQDLKVAKLPLSKQVAKAVKEVLKPASTGNRTDVAYGSSR